MAMRKDNRIASRPETPDLLRNGILILAGHVQLVQSSEQETKVWPRPAAGRFDLGSV